MKPTVSLTVVLSDPPGLGITVSQLMKKSRSVFIAVAVVATILSAAPAAAQNSAAVRLGDPRDAAPLFDSHEVLELTLEGPLESVFKERSQESTEYPAAVSYVDASGQAVRVDLDLSTRGRRRLDPRICRFPPLRFDFPKSKVMETIFAGQDKVKLVTHCRDDRDEYEQYVLQEYLVYRVFNILSDLSFRVRLARITYVDLEESRDPLTRYAFLIEHKNRMAERNGWEILEVPAIDPVFFDPNQLGLVEVFQYMIGNTDWSAFRAPRGEPECCHNTKAVGPVAGPAFSVPYDFDQSGVVSTRYASPDKRFGLRNVRQRLYRGICRPQEDLAQTVATFNEHREAIYALYRGQANLDPERLERMLEYYDDFYEVINNEGKFGRALGDCRRMPS